MGAFTDDNRPEDTIKMDGDLEQNKTEDGFQTDVDGVKSQGSIKRGKDEFPCFDVSYKEFYQNMEGGRRRIRFDRDTPQQKYFQKSKYQRKFYIKYTDDKGKALVRPIK